MLLDDMPNLIVYGVGHSGTSIITKMYGAMGWNIPRDNRFAEPADWCVPYNGMIVRHMKKRQRPDDLPVEECVAKIREGFDKAPEPFALKDPRFVLTLPLFDFDAVLVHVTRNRSAVANSYRKRMQYVNGEPGAYGFTLNELYESSEKNLSSWKGDVHKIACEDIRDPERMNEVFQCGWAKRIREVIPQ